MLSFNQIAGFFDHQYLWNKAIIVLDFCVEMFDKKKIKSKGTNVGWVWPDIPITSRLT